MPCDGCHLGFPIYPNNKNVAENYPNNIPAKFDFKWFNGLKEEQFHIIFSQGPMLKFIQM